MQKMPYIEKFKNEQHPFFKFLYSLQFAWAKCWESTHIHIRELSSVTENVRSDTSWTKAPDELNSF